MKRYPSHGAEEGMDLKTSGRFMEKVCQGKDGCWVWKGCLTKKGYGRFRWGARMWWVHRLAYLTWKGPLTEGMHVHHVCHRSDCVNPRHLEEVEGDWNSADGGRQNGTCDLPI